MNRNRIPLPAAVILVMALAVVMALGVWTLALADCPEPTPAGGCGVDTILSNLMRSQVQRSNAIGAANRPKALEAHADYMKGMTYRALQEKYHLAPATMRDHWRKAGLPFAGIGERRPRTK